MQLLELCSPTTASLHLPPVSVFEGAGRLLVLMKLLAAGAAVGEPGQPRLQLERFR